MTKKRRILNLITGILMAGTAALLAFAGAPGIGAVLLFLGIGFFLRGCQSLLYYLMMARSMVGGKRILFRAILFLDLWMFTASVAETGQLMGIVYVAALHLFYGIVEILRAADAKRLGAHWRFSMMQGAGNSLLALAVIVSGIGMGSAAAAVYAYALGLAYSGCTRIASAFRRTAIVYIQ